MHELMYMMMMMMLGVVLGVVCVKVVVNLINQDQNELADLSSAFCSNFLPHGVKLAPVSN